jgi:hypothetical protein
MKRTLTSNHDDRLQVARRKVLTRLLAGILAGSLVLSYGSRPQAEEAGESSAGSVNQLVPDATLKPQARCKVGHETGRWWLVSPEGQEFFSRGVCVLDRGAPRDKYDAANPGYAAWQHYDSPGAWADASLTRLKSWGFTTIGGWSDLETLRQSPEQSLWMTPVLSLGSSAGAPWWDMWDEKNLRRMEEIAVERIVPVRDDPRVIGYYSDNELGWWNATLWRMTLEQPATSGQRQRLIQLLHEIYHDDWSALIKDFEPEHASNWDELEHGGMLRYRPGSNGIRTMRRFLAMVADRYYQLMRDVIHKYDPGALYLGDRYQSFYYPEVAQASSRYVDVVSTNLNAQWNDGTFLRYYLDTLHALTGKPILVTEFYMSAEDNRSGNKNASSSFPVVATQPERAKALSNTLQELVRLPYVVGADWFQYYDEPTHGRGDGEDYDFGLVDIHDQPYQEVTAAFKNFDIQELEDYRRKSRPDASGGVPPAPADPFADFQILGALKQWDRNRGYVKSSTDRPLADLYVCWAPDAIYAAVYAIDVVESEYYGGAPVPEVDRATWSVQWGDHKPVVARIGGGPEPQVNDSAVRVEGLSGVDHEVRCIAVMKWPAELLDKKRLKAGDKVELHSTLWTHGRAYRMEWKGTFTLSD